MLFRTPKVSVFLLLLAAPAVSQSGAGSEPSFWGWLMPLILLSLFGVAGVLFFLFRYSKNDSKTLSFKDDTAKNLSMPQTRPRKEVRNGEIRQRRRPANVAVPKSPTAAQPEAVDIRDLPISRIESISPPPEFEPLSKSDDEGLLAAIDEIQIDGDADSDVRLIALRVLAGFRTKNSIEELSQVALYDLSSNMRSRAVGILADHNHESVFEPIVLACADPSREVRAAGARALFKVTFDRADAWARFAFSRDQYIGRQIARAAVEAGIVERSFDRLAMRDEKAAYEAFALVYLLIRSGETEKIFDAVRNHHDLNVRLALLHSIKAANVAEVIPQLSSFISAEPISSSVADQAREVLLGITSLPVGV